MGQIMKSFRQILPAICVILIASAFAGCGAAEQRPALGRIEYTNLNDSGSRELFGGCSPTQACQMGVFRAFSIVRIAFMTA